MRLDRNVGGIRGWLANSHVAIVAVALGVFFALPSLYTGLIFDDLIHREILLGRWPVEKHDASLFGLFSWLDGDPARNRWLMKAGLIPWWTYEEVHAAFWRPVTEITHWLDYRLWPDNPVLMHAQSLLWYASLIAVVAVLYRRFIAPAWAAGLGTLLFAVDAAHTVPVTFLANRNALISAFFSVLALLFHDAWRRNGRRGGLLYGSLSYIVGLLSGEAALGVLGYFLAYSLFLDRGEWRRRTGGLLPYLLITALWGMLYQALGFGASGMGGYVDPVRDTGRYLRASVDHVPVLLLGQFAFPPADLYSSDIYKFLPYGNNLAWLIAVLFVVGIAVMLWPWLRHDAVVRFWCMGMLFSLLPVCAAFPSNRLLMIPGIGAIAVIATFMTGWSDRAEWLPRATLWRGSFAVLFWVFLVLHVVLSPVLLAGGSWGVSAFNRILVVQPALTMPYGSDIASRSVILLNPPSAFLSLAYDIVRKGEGLPVPRRTHALASGVTPLTITRTSTHSIQLIPPRGFLPMTFDRLPRPQSKPMSVGQQIDLDILRVEVLELCNGGEPARAQFTASVPLDDPSLLFLRWDKGRFVPFALPDVGTSATLPSVKLF